MKGMAPNRSSCYGCWFWSNKFGCSRKCVSCLEDCSFIRDGEYAFTDFGFSGDINEK